MAKEAEERVLPPYSAWKTFTTFLDRLKGTAVPPRIDNSIMPSTWSGGMKSELRGALRFLGLIDSAGNVADKFKTLVKSYGEKDWTEALSEVISDAYVGITKNLDLDSGTANQLREQFRAAGVEGNTLDKAVRFFLAAMTAAGWNFSPHFTSRGNRTSAPRKKPIRTAGNKEPADETDLLTDEGGGSQQRRKFVVPIPGKADVVVLLPHDITEAEWGVVDISLKAYVKLGRKAK